MYLLKSVPAQSHCSKHVEVFFDNLFTIHEEYSSPKSIWQKHFKHHIRLFLPALYILKVIFSTFKSDPSYHSTQNVIDLPCLFDRLSTDPYMVTMTNNYSFLKLDTTNSTPVNIQGYNDQQLLLAITQYNKLHTTEPACTSTMEYLHTVKLYWKKRILENNALPECCALTA